MRRTLVLLFALLFAGFKHGGSSGLNGALALNRAYDLGVSSTDNISNYPKPPLVLTISSDTNANAVINITANGSSFQTHTLTVSDYNAGTFSQSVTPLSDGTYVMAGTINDGGVITSLTGFTYILDTSISTPTLNGTSPAFVPNPSYTVTFGATKPVVGDILVVLVNNVANNTKTLGAGDLTSTSISATGLAVGNYQITVYVYSPTGNNKFSQMSAPFTQLITGGDFYNYVNNFSVSGAVNPTVNTFDLGSHSANFLVVAACFGQGAGNTPSATVAGTSLSNTDLTGIGGNGTQITFLSGTLTAGQSGNQTVSISFSNSVFTARGCSLWALDGLNTFSAKHTVVGGSTPQNLAVDASDIVVALSTGVNADYSGSSPVPSNTHTYAAVDADWLILSTGTLTIVPVNAGGGFSAGAASYR